MIVEIIENKLDYAQLLCESDPNINLVEDYLRKGRLFVYRENNDDISFIVVQMISPDMLEIKNLLTLQKYRGHGYAKKLIEHIEKIYKDVPRIIIGTANSSMSNMTFYTKLGYRYSHKVDDFFIDYYPQEIYENGIQAVDLMYFEKNRYAFH
ncbi:MAG: GNAT family N-acetyltransferase [Faecalibacillus sp.]